MKVKYLVNPVRKELNKRDLKTVVRSLRTIEKKYQIITPNALVEVARPASSPLHKFFEWNDVAAADKFREWQARHLIAQVYVVPADSPESIPVRAFVNVDDGVEDESFGRGYVSTASVPGNQNYQAQVLEYAEVQLKIWRRKFGAFDRFFKVVREIDRLE